MTSVTSNGDPLPSHRKHARSPRHNSSLIWALCRRLVWWLLASETFKVLPKANQPWRELVCVCLVRMSAACCICSDHKAILESCSLAKKVLLPFSHCARAPNQTSCICFPFRCGEGAERFLRPYRSEASGSRQQLCFKLQGAAKMSSLASLSVCCMLRRLTEARLPLVLHRREDTSLRRTPGCWDGLDGNPPQPCIVVIIVAVATCSSVARDRQRRGHGGSSSRKRFSVSRSVRLRGVVGKVVVDDSSSACRRRNGPSGMPMMLAVLVESKLVSGQVRALEGMLSRWPNGPSIALMMLLYGARGVIVKQSCSLDPKAITESPKMCIKTT